MMFQYISQDARSARISDAPSCYVKVLGEANDAGPPEFEVFPCQLEVHIDWRAMFLEFFAQAKMWENFVREAVSSPFVHPFTAQRLLTNSAGWLDRNR